MGNEDEKNMGEFADEYISHDVVSNNKYQKISPFTGP